jgi:hypothetical protein
MLRVKLVYRVATMIEWVTLQKRRVVGQLIVVFNNVVIKSVPLPSNIKEQNLIWYPEWHTFVVNDYRVLDVSRPLNILIVPGNHNLHFFKIVFQNKNKE